MAAPHDELHEALAFCHEILPDVSRTFAINIRALPEQLEPAVTVAYLLCRLADTVEDEVQGGAARRRELLAELARIVTLPDMLPTGERFAREVRAALRANAPAGEVRLVTGTPHLLRAFASLPSAARNAIVRCIQDMISGMGEIAVRIEKRGELGLLSIEEMLEYCDYVAGTVGRMLTRLFLLHVPALETAREQMEARAESCGRTLQLTNILRDIRKDWERGYCWLPCDLLERHGVTAETLLEPSARGGAMAALDELVALAYHEAVRAFEYVLLVPRTERRIRLVCIWPLFTALLTLSKLRGNPGVFEPHPVKVHRSTVKAVVFLTGWIATNDRALTLIFRLLAGRLDKSPGRPP